MIEGWLHAIFGITRGTPFTVQKALPLFNVFADFTNRCVIRLDGSEP
jgi:hypothetical protein